MGPKKPIGTADVPPQLWAGAHLVGATPFLASSYDQRASYCMYVPEAHYQVDASPKLPLIINVHGSMRRAETCRDSLIDLADHHGAAILAPLFPAGIGDPNDTHNYKFLRYGDIRYDLILLSIVDEVAQRWPGIETQKFYLAGFSGGGQFVSRFFYLYPHRLEGVSIGAPGMVTSLDHELDWPRGLKGVEDQFEGMSVDTGALKSVPYVQLIVGEDDNSPPGGAWLRWHAEQSDSNKLRFKAAAPSLVKRTDSAAQLRAELIALGVNVQFDTVPGARHEGMKVFPTVITFLLNALANRRH